MYRGRAYESPNAVKSFEWMKTADSTIADRGYIQVEIAC